jgi:hypothetical protein
MALAAIRLGPDRVPPEAFTDELHESVLGELAGDPQLVKLGAPKSAASSHL